MTAWGHAAAPELAQRMARIRELAAALREELLALEKAQGGEGSKSV